VKPVDANHGEDGPAETGVRDEVLSVEGGPMEEIQLQPETPPYKVSV
jgi:hypothetical protein